MSVASIDLAQMAALVRALEDASVDVPAHRSSLRSGLDQVMLSTAELARVDAVAAWVERELPGLRRRLALARHIEAQTPGVQGYVQLDEASVPTTTPEEARELADRAAELIDDYGSGDDLPQELVDLLAKNGADPYFAHQLATKVSPEELADLVLDASTTRRTLVQNSFGSDIDDIEAFDESYEQLLDGLGTTFGTATQSGGDLALPDGYAQEWSDAITEEYPEHLGQASALGLVLSRGTFGADFLTTVAQDVYAYERQTDQRDMWYDRAHTMGDGFGAIDPVQGDDEGAPTGYTEYYDPLAGILTAVGRSPQAAQNLFGSGEVVTISEGGTTATTNAFLEYVLARRRWPVDDGAGSNAAIAAAITPFEGGSVEISQRIAQDARAVIEIKAAEIEASRKSSNPFSDIGHLVLDGLGLVPFLGEPADAINAVWYAAEGNAVDAGLSAAGLIPFLGWGATGGKWTRRALRAEDLAELAARGIDVDELLELGAKVDVVARADGLPMPHLQFDDMASFNRVANSPHPNTVYEYNGIAWETDALGRTKSVSGQVNLGDGGRNSTLTAEIGNEGLPNDIGFHLIADSLGGPTNRLNVLPGNGKPYDGLVNLNQGEWARMERQIRRALRGETPGNVTIHIEPKYRPGNESTRPDRFAVELNIDGQTFKYDWTNDAQPPR